MTDNAPKPDYRDTVFLPKTDFPMKASLPQKEPAILARWEAEGLYARLRAARQGREKFILHDGPPYANGDMHIGHALNHILKDMVCRTQSLLGRDAPYVPGWDCHGLPIEWKVEEQYRKQKRNKDDVPVKEFRAECRAYAQHWVNVQREQVKRLGVLGNWDKPYLTMDFDSEATIVSELLKFAESGQLYRGAKPVMWSPVEKTALAEAEIEYEEITSTQIDVAFEIVESPKSPAIQQLLNAGKKVYAIIWTTTPWTIPVNQAIAYGQEVDYEIVYIGGIIYPAGWVGDVEDQQRQIEKENIGRPFLNRWNDSYLVIASDLREELSTRLSTALGVRVPVLPKAKAGDLAGTIARHPMHHLGGFFAKPRPFLPGDFVTTDSGTGLVHMAPDHGEDDFYLCKAHGIDPVFAVTADGKYRDDWAWLGGQGSVIHPKFNAPDGPICTALRDSGALLAASANYRHSYPHSWRSKAKVIYRCTPQWFVPMDKGEASLRQKAMSAIAATRFVPGKGRNRIGAMVESRPDWVLSRQRAWGVPITLFVDRKTGHYLNDKDVNARIIAAVKKDGVDAWEAARAQEFLGEKYRAEDYEQIFDILDVWFDSGCTHVFTLESGTWPELKWPADLYLEGSDQHRGWFQSSLLQSCATRGRAPYDQVLTHGFTMDAKGLKMSKSIGNTVDPLKVMETHGADIIRLWALSVDFTEDHRIGDEILKGVGDQYRKLRNTFRYLLGALDGFTDAEKVAVADMPELERYVLHLLAEMDSKLKQAVNDFDFNTYTRLLSDFANNDLSAFFFDIRKDSLYCDAPTNPNRMAYRTVLDILFHALVRYTAPVLVFTAEEIWLTRFPDADSVHLLEWPEVPVTSFSSASLESWKLARQQRREINGELERLRREKKIGSSLEAVVNFIPVEGAPDSLARVDINPAEFLIVSACLWWRHDGNVPDEFLRFEMFKGTKWEDSRFDVAVTPHAKCARCWRHLPDVGTHADHPDLCSRCHAVVTA